MQPCNSSTLKKRKADDLTTMLQQEDTSEESAMPSSYRSLLKFLRYQTPEINAAVSESGLWLWRRSARDGCEGHTAKGKKRSCVRPTDGIASISSSCSRMTLPCCPEFPAKEYDGMVEIVLPSGEQ